ncbi:hypothetical protein GGR54DRAFT_531612 [Hypoxylon sp. NC1633]|nr:hypothetical protein GGR54DRAFT_531612 [Hypoxylon sp. NC1633]
MSLGHPYQGLQVPSDAPFELRPSPGKGWGAFATTRIKQGAIILREKPLFVIPKPHTEITDADISVAFQKLSPRQKQQFLLLRNNASSHFTKREHAFAENSFRIMMPNSTGSLSNGPAHGLYLLHSRMNHSCIPNSTVPTTNGIIITSYATRDIPAGEEITICYGTGDGTDYEARTRQERMQALGFVCDCKACTLCTSFQQLSDLRRRFIRGLQYLLNGEDSDGQRLGSDSPIVIDPVLKNQAETRSIPVSSRLIYLLLIVFLLEEEGVLDDFMVERLRPIIDVVANMFKTESNARIARLAMAQTTWRERLCIAFGLWGRGDVVDQEVAGGLQQLAGLF